MRTRLLGVAFLGFSLVLLFSLTLVAHGANVDSTQLNHERTCLNRTGGVSFPYQEEITASSTFTIYLPVISKEFTSWARNDSYPTTCAEEDNINVPLFARQITHFQIVATHPTYTVGVDNCNPDFSGCPRAANQTTDTCSTLYNDGINIVQGCTTTGWWRLYTMNIVVGSSSGSYHYLVLYRKIQDANSWPQFLVLYEDGNIRLKPQPPVGFLDVCFGCSVIVGPAVLSSRPYADIQEVRVNPSTLSLDLIYRNAGTAHISLSVDRSQAIASVDVNYPTSATTPFAVFRCMYVSDGNADVDHVQVQTGDYPILTGWTVLEGPWWFFHRIIRSTHNTSAPDVRIGILN